MITVKKYLLYPILFTLCIVLHAAHTRIDELADKITTWKSNNIEALAIVTYAGHEKILFGSQRPDQDTKYISLHDVLDAYKKDETASISIERALYLSLITNTCDVLKQRKKAISGGDYKGISSLEQKFLFTEFPQNRAKKALTQLQAHLHTNFGRNPSVHAANTLSQEWYRNDGTCLGMLPKDISLHIIDYVCQSIPCSNITQSFMPFSDLLFCYQQAQHSHSYDIIMSEGAGLVAGVIYYPQETVIISGKSKKGNAAYTLWQLQKKITEEKDRKEAEKQAAMQTYFYIPTSFNGDV
jgi:hypothetical protein